MKLLQIVWNYIPALIILGVLEGLITYHTENADYEDYNEREGLPGGAAPYLTKPLSSMDCKALGTTKRFEFRIE